MVIEWGVHYTSCGLNTSSLIIILDIDARQPEASPAEYSKANKELRKLRDSTQLINELRTKQKVNYFCIFLELLALCIYGKDRRRYRYCFMKMIREG